MEKYILNSQDSVSLYKLLNHVINIFDQNKIVYWLCAGTFLGAVRCNGIIKWDDDLDISVPIDYKETIIEIFKNDPIFRFRRSKLVDKICYRNIPGKTNGRDYGFPFCDIFFMNIDYRDNRPAYVYSSKQALKKWPNEYLYLDELFPLKMYDFGAQRYYGPKKYLEYFIRCYGKNWDKEGVITYDHKTEKNIPKIQWKLRESDYEPAKPFFYN